MKKTVLILFGLCFGFSSPLAAQQVAPSIDYVGKPVGVGIPLSRAVKAVPANPDFLVEVECEAESQ